MISENTLLKCLFGAILITLLGSGCADDATRIERAREYQAQADYRAATIELKNVLRTNPDNAEARTMLGQIALLSGDSATAIKELRRARELGASADIYTADLARALLREGRYPEVISLNPELLTDIEQRAAVLALAGTAELESGDKRAAEQKFEAALALAPEQSEALIGKARLAQARGDSATAEDSLQQMLKAKPDSHEGLAALARIQRAKGDYAQAEENLRKALEALKGTGRAHERLMYMSGLIDALLGQGKNTEAQAVGVNMLKMTSEHPIALLQAARADFAAKNYDGAIDKAERIITSAPSAEPPRLVLAAAAIAKGNSTLAATHLQAAININPANEVSRKLLAQVRMQMGDPDEALAVLQPMMIAGTNDAQILAMAGSATIRSGDTAAGVELVERGMEIDHSDPALVLPAAANFLAAGEIDRAIELLEGLPEAERAGQRELLLILALTRKGDIEGARAQAQATVDADPNSSASHRIKGGFHLAVGEFDQARAAFERALQIDPDDAHATLNLARIDISKEQFGRAEARFNELLQRQPGNLLALTALAELAQKRGSMDEALALLERAREANPEALAPLLTLGRYYLRTDNLGLAEERADQAVRVDSNNGQALVLLGTIMIDDGRHTEAIRHLERAIEVSPKLGSAHYQLSRAQMAAGRADIGYASLKKSIEVNPGDYRARAALTVAEVQRGDFNAALAVADGLINDYPERSEPLMLKGDVQAAREDYRSALDLFAQAAEVKPSRTLAVKRYELKRRTKMADPWKELEQWVAANPDDTEGRGMLARAYLSAGMNEQAIESFKQVMATAPDAEIAATLAIAYREAGDLDAAASWLEQAIDLDPDEMSARAALTAIELRRGNTEQSVRLIRNLRRDFPDAPELHALEGQVLLASKDYEGSLKAFDRAAAAQPSEEMTLRQYHARKEAGRDDAWRVLKNWIADHPGDNRAGITLAQDYSNRDWHDESIDAYRGVLSNDPGNVIALNNIAWVYGKRGNEGDIKRAVNSAAKAYEKNSQLAAIGDTYGWFLLQDGQGAEALKLLRGLAVGDDVDPEIRYHYAAALADQGQDSEAARVLDAILADDAAFDGREDAEVLRRRLD